MIRSIARCAVLPAYMLALANAMTAQPSLDAGPAAHALAGAITARSGSAFASWNAAASSDSGRTAHAHCRIVSGGLAGLFDGAITGTRSVDSTLTFTAGLAAITYGAYRAIDIMLSARRSLSDAMSVSVAARVETQTIDRYGTSAAILIDVGLQSKVVGSLSVGVVARNVARARMRGVARPQHIALGVLAVLPDSATLSIDVIHETGIGPTLSAGIEAPVAPRFVLRAGIALESPTVATGVGYCIGKMSVDFALSWSAAVGASYLGGASWRW